MAPRVLHIYAGNLYGGVETMLVALARHLDLAPGLVQEFALCFQGRLSTELRARGATVEDLGPARFRYPWTVLRARRRLALVLASRRFDAVVCHGAWSHALAAPAARRAGVPLVFWLHNLVRGRGAVERRAARTAPDLVIANSRCSASSLSGLFPGVACAIVPCPVGRPDPMPSGLRANLRRSLGADPGAVVILQASRLEPGKGHAVLLEALGSLRDRTNWEAWIAGGPQRPAERDHGDRLASAARRHGVAGRVRFLGQRDDVPQLLEAADVFCQPNTAPESFGIAFIEALDAGRPTVGTRLGGVAEIVTPECGILVEPGDANALADALAILIDDPAARSRLGAAGPARARSLCDPAIVLPRLETVIRGLSTSAGRGVSSPLSSIRASGPIGTSHDE